MMRKEMFPSKAALSYILTVLAASWLITILLFIKPEVGIKTFSIIMFIPAVAAIIFIKLQGGKLRGRRNKMNAKALGFGILFPLLLVALCAVISILSGAGSWRPAQPVDLKAIITVVVTILVNLVVVLGEEYGWRGYLLPELARICGKLKATFIVGIVWALYHMPAVYLLARATDMKHPLLTCAVQAGVVFAVSFAFSYAYYLSGSLIPVLFFHSVWNVINTTVLGDIYTNKQGLLQGDLFIMNGEGVMGLIVSAVLMWWFMWKLRKQGEAKAVETGSLQRVV